MIPGVSSSPLSDHDPLRALLAHHLSDPEQISGSTLLRAFVSHPGWQAALAEPQSQSGAIRLRTLRNSEGACFVQLFSDARALKDCALQIGQDTVGHTFLRSAGYALFALLPDNLDFVDINPLSPPSIHYRRAQLPTLRAWARGAQIEELLFALEESPETISRLRNHQPYYVLVDVTTEPSRWMIAPDSKRRQLAAVFTNEDCVEAYLRRLPPSLLPVQTLRLTGAELAESLLEESVEGIVFNCAGPVRPSAFSMDLLRRILQAI